MENWRARRDAAPDRAAVEAARDTAWREANRPANQRALAAVRALVPRDVAARSLAELKAEAEQLMALS